jgi:hypothetical protein
MKKKKPSNKKHRRVKQLDEDVRKERLNKSRF